jgi:hypothetical protein
MSSSAPTEAWHRGRFATASLFALVVAWYVPWSPPLPEASLDPAWKLALQIARDRGLRFGADLEFTYGPMGSVAIWQYWPSTYLAGALFWFATAGVATILIVRATPPGPRRIAAACGLLGFGLLFDAALLVLPLAVVLHSWRRSRDLLWSLAGLVLLAPLSFVKFTALPVCGLAVVTAGLLGDLPMRGTAQRFALFAGTFAVACLATWLATGQSLALLAPYLADSVEIARGYTQAMSLPPGMHGPAAILSLPVAVLFVVAAVDASRDLSPGNGRIRQLAWAGFVVCIALVVWRQGVVRLDRQHLFASFVIMGAGTLLIVATLRPRPRAVAAVLVGALAGLALASADWPGALFHDVLATRVGGLARAAAALSRLELPGSERERSLAAWRAGLRDPLAGRPGTYEILGHDQHLLVLRDETQWRPRPTLQGYAAYTPGLAARLGEWIRSPDAPRWLTIRPATIDARWAAQDDASLWPLLPSRYTVVDRLAGTLVLERRADPLPAVRSGTRSLDVMVRDWFVVPAEFQAGDVHLRITEASAHAGVAGRIFPGLGALFMEVREASGGEVRRFRLVPEIAAKGFLLSPDLRNPDDLEAWLRGREPAGARVLALRITDLDGVPVSSRLTFDSKPFPYPAAP